MSGTDFVDTNIILYRYSNEAAKSQRATELLDHIVDTGGVISVQILNEVAVAGKKMMGLSWAEIGELTQGLNAVFRVDPLTPQVHQHAITLVKRYQFSFWDSLVIASALEAGCERLYTEDLSHNQIIENQLKIINPFLD